MSLFNSKRKQEKKRRTEAEAYISTYEFPPSVSAKLQAKHPGLSDVDLLLVEQGLREWLICCLHREGSQVGMPSRLVDDAWHEFILSSIRYSEFCDRVYGEYMHHTPEMDMTGSGGADDLVENTIRAWHRSAAGHRGEAVMWAIDERSGVKQPIGIDAQRLARTRLNNRIPNYRSASNMALTHGFWAYPILDGVTAYAEHDEDRKNHDPGANAGVAEGCGGGTDSACSGDGDGRHSGPDGDGHHSSHDGATSGSNSGSCSAGSSSSSCSGGSSSSSSSSCSGGGSSCGGGGGGCGGGS